MKGQIMEWLMTYGWAILILVIVAAAAISLFAPDPNYAEIYSTEYNSCQKLAEHLEAEDWRFDTSISGDAICKMKLTGRCIVFEDNVNWCPLGFLNGWTEFRARLK